jgi:putative endonuclease
MSRQPSVYILASRPHGALYVGVTSNLARRVWQHRTGAFAGHTAQYRIHKLVYYETHPTMMTAIRREKQLKRWNRPWKIELIEQQNPEWRDLWPNVGG